MNKIINKIFIYLLLIITICGVTNIYSENLSFLCWNVENLFDTVDDPQKNDIVLTKQEYTIKIDRIAEFINNVKPDLVGLCEVENKEILYDLSLKTGYDYYYLIEGNDPRGIDVCLLSKIKLNYISHSDQPAPYKDNYFYKFSRDCPEAWFEFNGKEIFILMNHFKSQAGDKNKSLEKRIAQSKALLDIIAGIYRKNDKPYILIMGDFNSQRYSEPMNILEKSGLIILNYLKKEKNIFTINYHGMLNDIDYFLMNDIFYNSCKITRIKCFNKKENNISDHYPLYLEVDFK